MTNCIYDKTDKGREEIATRKYQLPPRLRTLLVMIDGRNRLDAVLKNIAGLGLNGESVNLLVANEYIRLVSGGEPAANEPAPAARRPGLKRPPPPRALRPAEPADLDAAPAIASVTAAAVSDAEQYRAVYEFFHQTIKSTLGLRGFALQLQVEKAASLAELADLRAPYVEAARKAADAERAAELAARLDALLGTPEALARQA